jgi:hypothetical protein
MPSADAPFAIEQAAHGPAHGELQHTPSAQFPDVHSEALAQLSPSFFLHDPAESQLHLPPQPPLTSSHAARSCALLTAFAVQLPSVPFTLHLAQPSVQAAGSGLHALCRMRCVELPRGEKPAEPQCVAQVCLAPAIVENTASAGAARRESLAGSVGEPVEKLL